MALAISPSTALDYSKTELRSPATVVIDAPESRLQRAMWKVFPLRGMMSVSRSMHACRRPTCEERCLNI